MAKKKLLATERQVRFARAFVKAIGGNQSNGYLLLAVLAWLKIDKDVQHFYHYASYSRGAQALANVLLHNPKRRAKGYVSVVRAARLAGKDAAQDARQFIAALAMSRFAKSHYGAPDGIEDIDNKLFQKWVKLTAGKAFPDAWFIDTIVTKTKAKPPKDPHRQPRSLLHVMPKPEYLQPYAARSFYEARPHESAFVLPQERW